MIRILQTAVLLVAGAASAAPVVLSPGVIVEAEERVAYAVDPGGFTQRVSLETGVPGWVSGERLYPLVIADGWLVGLGAPDAPGAANLILLDRQTGRTVDRISIDLPENVNADLFPQPQRRFIARALDTSEGVRVFWRQEFAELRGAAVVETDENGDEVINPVTVTQGAFDLVQSGERHFAVPVRDAFVEPAEPTVALGQDERITAIQGGTQFRAADDVHIMTSQAQPDERFGQLYSWLVYTREGRQLGAYRSPYSRLPFLVQGEQLLVRDQPLEYLNASGDWIKQGTRLVSIDLASGDERWSFAVLDFEYRGPLPP